MSKILISLLGTGVPTDKTDDTSPREYKTAHYMMEGESLGNHSFVTLALAQHLKVDDIILVGTKKSMWEEAYLQFKKQKEPGFDSDDIYWNLYEQCGSANEKSDLILEHKEEIEQLMGNNSHVVLVRYGLNKQEVQENINIILSLAEYLKRGDELIVDVTHSFRSFPILITQLLMYLKTVRTDIKVEHIYYAMLEANRDLNYAPIVDLSATLHVNDWIIGAYAFLNFGNGYKVAELVKDENLDVSNRINGFSNAIALNHFDAIQNQAQNLSGIKNKQYQSKLPQLIIQPVINSFINKFANVQKHAVFQLRLAEWQCSVQNYASAYLSVVEAIVSFVCEMNGLDEFNKDDREAAKKILRGDSYGSYPTGMDRIFRDLNRIRISIAHTRGVSENGCRMIAKLKTHLRELKTIIQ